MDSHRSDRVSSRLKHPHHHHLYFASFSWTKSLLKCKRSFGVRRLGTYHTPHQGYFNLWSTHLLDNLRTLESPNNLLLPQDQQPAVQITRRPEQVVIHCVRRVFICNSPSTYKSCKRSCAVSLEIINFDEVCAGAFCNKFRRLSIHLLDITDWDCIHCTTIWLLE